MSVYRDPLRALPGVKRDGRLALSNAGLWCVVLWEDGTASIHAKLERPATIEEWSIAVRATTNFDVDTAGDRMAETHGGRGGFWPMGWPADVPRPGESV